MKGGRKNLKRAAKEDVLALIEGQSIMQVLSLRGSNLIEVMDAKGIKSLALFPAKFQKSLWIRSGKIDIWTTQILLLLVWDFYSCFYFKHIRSFVVVDESGREKALESGSKVACMVSQVLYYEQLRELQKSTDWPNIFKATVPDDLMNGPPNLSQLGESYSSDDDNDLPPLEANTNRVRPIELHSASESDSESDS